MDIQKILEEYDAMFGKVSLSEIEAFLFEKLQEAAQKREDAHLFTLLNEMIGFCRDTTQKDKALKYCSALLTLLERMNLTESVEGATAFLNIANAYRAFGLWEQSLQLYERVYANYKKNLPENAFSFASLFNNWSLLYQEMEDYEKAREMLMGALVVVDLYDEATIQQATTRTNLANTLLQMESPQSLAEAKEYLNEALRVFEKDGGQDFHYSAALVAMGDFYNIKGQCEDALLYYKKGLKELEKHVGRNDNFYRVFEKYQHVREILIKQNGWKSNLEQCREFYEKYGKSMIHDTFPEYESRIAVGLVGEGSDCFGFDDEISMDHDYSVGFCMWLADEDYSKIGETLNEEYKKLVKKYGEVTLQDEFIGGRRGAFSISGFYHDILGEKKEYQLAQAVNGEVFRDDLGEFSSVRRELLKYYPENVWREKLAAALHDFSQYAQSNYPRMMARQDYVTAGLCISKAIESAMDIAYLLNKTYAPYYKWKKKGLEKLEALKELSGLIEAVAVIPCQKEAWNGYNYCSSKINQQDKCVLLFEEIAAEILKELTARKLVQGRNLFLENYVKEIIEGKSEMNIVDKIIQLEWEQFDLVKNQGGRAFCQDDWDTFSIMRKSQYLTWNEELLESYCRDLEEAKNKGWNLIMEKYARMMKSTVPEEYAVLEKDLPLRSEERIMIQEEIIKIQIAWMEEFAKEYPKMAGNARSIHTYEDNAFNTSYETYLRGELGTYGEETFVLYGRFVADYLKEGKNLAYEIMNNTAKLYGYESAATAEEKL